MATLLKSRNRLMAGTPPGFAATRYIGLALQYRVNGGDYLFSYKSASAEGQEAELARLLKTAAWSQYLRWEDLKPLIDNDMDIEIKADSVVQVDTDGPDLFWSLTRDAVMTEEDHSSLYGELRYGDGSGFTAREDFAGPSCRHIRFKAKLKPGNDPERHKFSYNVLLRDENGVMVEHEIDPDIKNPSV